MASENVNMENQLQSAQKNLLFLQQDHANTLKGLHAEIKRLQQHCTDLTYELTFRSSDAGDDGEERCRELQRRCEELEVELKAKERENAELLRELEQKNAMISVLENTIREREKKYLDELKLKSHRLAVLSGELEQRASTIAYLTSQLHATKKRLLAGTCAPSPSPTPSPGPGSSPTPGPGSAFRPTPPPPSSERDGQVRQPDTPRRRMRKSLSQPLHSEYTELYRLGAADGRRLVLRDAVDAMPDPTPFLQPRETTTTATGANAVADTAPLLRERPPVIPPIASGNTTMPAAVSTSGSPVHVPPPHRATAHVGVAHRIRRSPSAGRGGGAGSGGGVGEGEVETLAVDQVAEEKVVRKRSGADRTV